MHIGKELETRYLNKGFDDIIRIALELSALTKGLQTISYASVMICYSVLSKQRATLRATKSSFWTQ